MPRRSISLTRRRRFFSIHLVWAFIALVAITWVDVQICKADLSPLAHPEILGWGLWFVVLWTIICLTYAPIIVFYYMYTRDLLGTVILLAVSLTFFVFLMEDVLFYWMRGEPLPGEWTWTWQTKHTGKPITASDVLRWVNVGIILISVFILVFHKATKRRR